MFIGRTTITMASRQSLENLEAVRQRRQRATEEIATGLRVARPSDGPTEAAGIVQTQTDLQALSQFGATLGGINDQLRVADTALNQAIDLLLRAQTLASQGSNFTQTADTRRSLATEVDGLLQQMITIGNISFGGKFLFSGLNEDVQPFVPDATNPDGVIYRGDQGRRSIAFPGGTEAAVTVDGQSIFLSASNFLGSGRTAGTAGAATPAPPVGVGISFSNGLTDSITADLASFFVAAAPPTVPAAGDQVTVNFASTDSSINASITATLAGGESSAQIASALNAQIAATPALAGKLTFSDAGGKLKLVESDSVGVGFTFTSSATGGLVTGLESGGAIGGLSAQEIAAALNAQVAASPALTAAKVRFSAVGGQVQVDSNVGLTFRAVDFARGAGFVSGLAGQHSLGGQEGPNVFRVLNDLHKALAANDPDAVRGTLNTLANAVQHLSNVQGFYGAAQRQVLSAVDQLKQFQLVNQDKLSSLEDADLARAATDLAQAQINEQAVLQVAGQRPRSLFDFLA